MLWQPGDIGTSPLAFGARGRAVQQLRSKLLRVAQQPQPAVLAARYDSALLQLVEDFQRRSHLAVDGVAGEQTLIALDSVLPAPDTPQLTHSGADAGADAAHD